jgi:hypothetical protein
MLKFLGYDRMRMMKIDLLLVETILEKIIEEKNCSVDEILKLKHELNVDIIEIIDVLDFLLKTETIKLSGNKFDILNSNLMQYVNC